MKQTTARPRFIVHGIAEARAALAEADRLGVAVILQSPPGGAAYMGAAFFRELVAVAKESSPGADVIGVLDCGAEAGHAMAAIRAGVDAVIFTGGGEASRRLKDIGAQSGTEIETTAAPALDLGEVENIAGACREWLAGQS